MNDRALFNSKQIGEIGEKAASELIEQKGFKILERNFRYRRLGEIDIIAVHEKDLHFIEVKARSSRNFGLPSESVTSKKIRKIRMLAQLYLLKYDPNKYSVRFDVIEVFVRFLDTIQVYKLNHIEDAF